MVGNRIRVVLFVGFLALLAGCFGGSNNSDLTDFINETKRRPKGEIEPIPSFRPYQAFAYDAQRLRDPFDRPIIELQDIVVGTGESVEPDLNRAREVLEDYNIASLSMVGTFRKQGTLWALISDGDGHVIPVRDGNYLGKNHGRIVSTTNNHISVIEIVPNGIDGWIQRPQSLKLEEKE